MPTVWTTLQGRMNMACPLVSGARPSRPRMRASGDAASLTCSTCQREPESKAKVMLAGFLDGAGQMIRQARHCLWMPEKREPRGHQKPPIRSVSAYGAGEFIEVTAAVTGSQTCTVNIMMARMTGLLIRSFFSADMVSCMVVPLRPPTDNSSPV